MAIRADLVMGKIITTEINDVKMQHWYDLETDQCFRQATGDICDPKSIWSVDQMIEYIWEHKYNVINKSL